jgi:hypothetical protein
MILNKEGFVCGLDNNEVFVFGSNMNGFHYGGAARQASEWGAIIGIGVGRQGKTYAIPTLDTDLTSKLPLKIIQTHLNELFVYAKVNLNTIFLLTPIGTGIAGFTFEEINSILPELPKNIIKVGNWY